MHKTLLDKIFKNKDYEENRHLYGLFASILGIVSNFMLFVIKYILGVFSFSLSIKADAFNNLFDSLSSLISLFGFKISNKPADKHHPYGHARFEIISELFVSLIICFFGVMLMLSSVNKILVPSDINFTYISLILLVFTSFTKLWQGSFYKYVANEINSSLLLTTANDSYNDVLINISVLIGLLIQKIFDIHIDGILGLLLSIYIVISGFSSINTSIKELLGKQVDERQLFLMEKLLLTYEDILGYHDLMVHIYGPSQMFASVHIEVDSKLSLIKAHNIAERIERDFLDDLNINLVVHIDPIIQDDPIISEYVCNVKELVFNYNNDFSIHDFRLIKHKKNNIIFFDLVVENDLRSDELIICEITKVIKKVYVKDQVHITVDRNYLELGRFDEEN